MDLRFIDSLLCVIEHGSIVAAARQQGLTPAAISQRVQALERILNQPLLDRQANRVTPTRLCADLLPQMRALCEAGAALRRRADPQEPEGVLRLGAISTALTGMVPALLRALTEIAPRLELHIVPGQSAGLFAALDAGEIDAAMIVAPQAPCPPALMARLLREEPLCLLAPPDAPDMPLDALFRRYPHLAYDPQSWGGQIAARYIRDHALPARPISALDGLEAISALVADGIGVSLVPDWAGLTGARPLPDGSRYARQIVLMRRATARHEAAHMALDRALDRALSRP